QGLEQYRRQEFAAAVPLLAMALTKQAGHYGAEYLLAVCRVSEGRYQEAKEGLTRCLEQRPNFSWPMLLRGFAEMKLNNPAAALADYDVVLTNPPDSMARYVAH